MDDQKRNELLTKMVEILELPESAYEKATKRYTDISEWLNRNESSCKDKDPHIFPQGSFNLGTAIRPLNDQEEYDLDIACKLRANVDKATYSQFQLKKLIGDELELYRSVRNIQSPLSEKHRCWRLEYKDDLSFHIDIVPCIPENEAQRNKLYEALRNAGQDVVLASEIMKLSVAVTDDRKENYKIISDDWEISNPEGYSAWFKSRMKIYKSISNIIEAQVDKIPLYKRKTPLQRSIQLLKRHRDQWAKGHEDSKPISIIITTLAALSYEGQTDLYSTLFGILSNMGKYVRSNKPRVPNPTNPNEDFADKWSTAEGKKLRLEENFWSWLQQAQIDFNSIYTINDPEMITEIADSKLVVRLKSEEIRKIIGVIPNVFIKPKLTQINESESPKPWSAIYRW